MVGINVLGVGAETKLERQLASNYNRFRDLLIKGIDVLSYQLGVTDHHFIISDGDDNIAITFTASNNFFMNIKEGYLKEEDIDGLRVSYGVSDSVDEVIYLTNYGKENVVSTKLLIRIYNELINNKDNNERIRFKFL